MRKVLLSGLIGAAPGALFLLVVFILERTDVISSDASQIGFIAIPVLFLGALIGVAGGASGNPHAGKISLGALVGFVAGIAAGIGIDEVVRSGGIWLIMGVAGLIGGAALGAWWGERRS